MEHTHSHNRDASSLGNGSPMTEAVADDEAQKLAALACVKASLDRRRSLANEAETFGHSESAGSLSSAPGGHTARSRGNSVHVTVPVLSMNPSGSAPTLSARSIGGAPSLPNLPNQAASDDSAARGLASSVGGPSASTAQQQQQQLLLQQQVPAGPMGIGHFSVEEVDVTSVDAFQRVVVTGTSTLSGEAHTACALLARALELRQKHLFRKPTYYWGPYKPVDFPFSPLQGRGAGGGNPAADDGSATGSPSAAAMWMGRPSPEEDATPAAAAAVQLPRQEGAADPSAPVPPQHKIATLSHHSGSMVFPHTVPPQQQQAQASRAAGSAPASGSGGGVAAVGGSAERPQALAPHQQQRQQQHGHKPSPHHHHEPMLAGIPHVISEHEHHHHRHHSGGQEGTAAVAAAAARTAASLAGGAGRGGVEGGYGAGERAGDTPAAGVGATPPAESALVAHQVETGVRELQLHDQSRAPPAHASGARPSPKDPASQGLWGSSLVSAETGKQYGNLFWRRRPEPQFTPFHVPVPPEAATHRFAMVNGVVQVTHVSAAVSAAAAGAAGTPLPGTTSGGVAGPGVGDGSPPLSNATLSQQGAPGAIFSFRDTPAFDYSAGPSPAAHPIVAGSAPGQGGPSYGSSALPPPAAGLPSSASYFSAPASPPAAPGASLFPVPGFEEYCADYQELLSIIHKAFVKSFAFRRLELLESRFQLHVKLNADREVAESKANPHRDFYNTRKVDTHVHHSACMNQKHLLRFIKRKLKHCPDEVVIFRDGKYLTLAQVFESLSLTAYDLSIDSLDMHADWSTFHRFDRFNLKYSPNSSSRLREIFLKTDNLIKGRYLAEITKEVFEDLEGSKYQLAEYRLSIYGKSRTEWSTLAAWVVDNGLASSNVRWMIQLPRLYEQYKASGQLTCFQDMLDNFFLPLFEVTRNPSLDPKLHQFLGLVVGIDSVDDESVMESNRDSTPVMPSEWKLRQQPPYYYQNYFVAANLSVLNQYRASRGMTQFSFRPHAGEAGDIDHLAATFLSAESINHGINLKRSPAMQYLYYLAQVGLALSPLSNNRLFLDYTKNPFLEFFSKGLAVSLSTDDPLMLAFTKEPLLEEYCVAAQVWKLSSVDMCEIARNSVLTSGFEYPFKAHFIGQAYGEKGPGGNDIHMTNVPYIRLQYRLETLDAELALISEGASRSRSINSIGSGLALNTVRPPIPAAALAAKAALVEGAAPGSQGALASAAPSASAAPVPAPTVPPPVRAGPGSPTMPRRVIHSTLHGAMLPHGHFSGRSSPISMLSSTTGPAQGAGASGAGGWPVSALFANAAAAAAAPAQQQPQQTSAAQGDHAPQGPGIAGIVAEQEGAIGPSSGEGAHVTVGSDLDRQGLSAGAAVASILETGGSARHLIGSTPQFN